jgi:hypothetical protein
MIGPAARCLRRESRWLILGTPPMSRAGRNQKRSALAARSELAIVTISGAGGAYCSRNKRVARRCWHAANSVLIYTILYYTILYYTILYYTILFI